MSIKELVKTSEYKEIVKFLKKEKLYPYLQKRKTKHCWDSEFEGYVLDITIHNAMSSVGNYSDFALVFSRNLPVESNLITSQIWRFFILEEIKAGIFKPDIFDLELLTKKILSSIEANGYRRNERIKELFIKHNINNNKNKDNL
jgi:hypothetical protein